MEDTTNLPFNPLEFQGVPWLYNGEQYREVCRNRVTPIPNVCICPLYCWGRLRDAVTIDVPLTDLTSAMKTYIGVFSQKARNEYGSVIYLSVEGKEVEVTGVYRTIDEANDYGWDDKVIIDVPLVSWVRDGRKVFIDIDNQLPL